MTTVNPPTALTEWLTAGPRMHIGGRSVAATDGETIEAVDPATEEVITRFPRGTVADADAAVSAARSAFEDRRWSGLRPSKRTEILSNLAGLIRANMAELAELESLDTGKPLRQASGEIWLAAETFRYYAGWPTKISGDTLPSGDDTFTYSLREPVGVCAGITAWNFPFLLAAFKVAPALAFGNTLVVKPAEAASLSTLRLAELAQQAGVPDGVLNVVTGFGPEVGARLAEHPDVDKIAFTGSTEVGRRILHASEGNLKRVSLELGGKSPNIVFDDADIERAVDGTLYGMFLNSGQMCTAGTRVLVEASVHDDFVDALATRARGMRLGRGTDKSTELGPLISAQQRDRVLGYVEVGRAEGARLATGGGRPSEPDRGFFVEPTIFVDVDNSMRIAQEEIFGPVAAVIPVYSVEEAIRIGNDTDYGLAAAVWTADLSRAHRVAKGLRAGTVWVNTYGVLDPVAPFGGFRQSGHGRELGRDSMELYTESKTVLVRL